MTPGTGLVTRGMGAKNLLVVRGMTSFEHEVIVLAEEALMHRVPHGRRPKDERYGQREYDVLISARVLEVNGIEPPRPIKGHVRVTFSNDHPPVVRIVETKSRSVRDKIVIRVRSVSRKRLK